MRAWVGRRSRHSCAGRAVLGHPALGSFPAVIADLSLRASSLRSPTSLEPSPLHGPARAGCCIKYPWPSPAGQTCCQQLQDQLALGSQGQDCAGARLL
jgi:hypothetical protein